ncbi:RDH13 [Mytilus coruscus]|uniref:RDH13 n=1 Tax=Mytilus coruscus TaxID=42192 RepID=A0A6J8A3Q0_MYTCO|nr:RDH13 [Mytilus coruscus]
MSSFSSKAITYSFTIGAIGGMIIILKRKAHGITFNGDERIHGRTVIVTGANCGIGYQTAGMLAARGGRVIMACRDMKKCEDAKEEIIKNTWNKKVFCKHLDLASLDSIREFAEDFNKNESRLDILINNAGIMRCPKQITKDGFEMQLGVNYLGHFLLTNLLLDKLKRCAPSRIVNLIAISQKKGKINFEDLNSDTNYDAGKAYDQSQLAIMLFTKELAQRLDDTGVTVNAAYPGITKSELGRHLSVNKSYISSFFMKPINYVVMRTLEEGSATPVHCAIAHDVRNTTGKLFYNMEEKEVTGDANNENIAKRLWLTSEKWTRLTD